MWADVSMQVRRVTSRENHRPGSAVPSPSRPRCPGVSRDGWPTSPTSPARPPSFPITAQPGSRSATNIRSSLPASCRQLEPAFRFDACLNPKARHRGRDGARCQRVCASHPDVLYTTSSVRPILRPMSTLVYPAGNPTRRTRLGVGLLLVSLVGVVVQAPPDVLAGRSDPIASSTPVSESASGSPRIRVVVPGTAHYGTSLEVATNDGAHVFLTSWTPLVPGSQDWSYDAVAGRFIPVVRNPGTFIATRLTTPDAEHVVVQTQARLTPDDTDGSVDDLFLLSPGSIERITTATDTMIGKALFLSDDGSEILLSSLGDIYRWVAGSPALKLLTPNTDQTVTFLAASTDGSRILIQTDEALTGIPIDDGIYEPTKSGYTLRGAGVFRGMSEDGSRVFSRTTEVLTPDDVYGEDDDAYLSTDDGFELLTPGPYAALDIGGISADGSRWLLDTTEAMTAEDLDTSFDVYLVHDGVFDLISGGDTDASSSILSADGRYVVYLTTSALVPEDDDSYFDLYRVDSEHLDQPTLLSLGNAYQGLSATHISQDGNLIFIGADGKLLPGDQNDAFDVYVWRDGDLTMMSPGSDRGMRLTFVSDDMQRALFTTNAKLDPLDINGSYDVYSWDLDVVPPVPTISPIAPYTTSTLATFQIGAAADDAVWFDCRLDNAAWSRCGSTATFDGLSAGPHSFEVHAFDAAANRSVLPTTRSWTIDVDPPNVTAPTVRLLSGTTISQGRAKMRVVWSADEAASAIDHHELERKIDAGPWIVVSSTLIAPIAEQFVDPAHVYQYRARAIDRAGNVGPWQSGGSVTVAAIAERSPRITYTGSWKTSRSPALWGGRAMRSSSAGATASITFTGRSIAWVSRMGPERGKARIFVNGVRVATVDLRSSKVKNQRVVWAVTWGTAASRTVSIRVRGTAGRPWVELDGFVTAS